MKMKKVTSSPGVGGSKNSARAKLLIALANGKQSNSNASSNNMPSHQRQQKRDKPESPAPALSGDDAPTGSKRHASFKNNKRNKFLNMSMDQRALRTFNGEHFHPNDERKQTETLGALTTPKKLSIIPQMSEMSPPLASSLPSFFGSSFRSIAVVQPGDSNDERQQTKTVGPATSPVKLNNILSMSETSPPLVTPPSSHNVTLAETNVISTCVLEEINILTPCDPATTSSPHLANERSSVPQSAPATEMVSQQYIRPTTESGQNSGIRRALFPSPNRGLEAEVQASPDGGHPLIEREQQHGACRRELFPSDNDGNGWEVMVLGPIDGEGHQLLVTEEDIESMEVVTDNYDHLTFDMENVDEVLQPMEAVLPEPEITPPVTRKRRQPAPIRNSPRKRKLNVVSWKATAAKVAHNAGLAHVNWRGKEISAKHIGPGCSPTDCKRKCHQNVSMEEREKLFSSYYSISDANRKWDFISRLVQKVPVARQTTDDISRRLNTYRYSVHLSDGSVVMVCQKFFLDTISQSQQVIKTALTKLEKGGKNVISPDKRGRQKKRGEINAATKASVRAHIASIPTVESHYCRKTSKYKYLPDGFNVRKLHSLYSAVRKDVPHTANLRQYRDIFKNEFNLKFLKLKKDRCSQCENWKYRTQAEKNAAGEQEKFDMHLANKKRGQELKRDDSKRTKTDPTLCVASFDFQKILYCPKGENAAYFYRNKLKCYDFTIFDHCTKEGWCFVWDQTIASKGANEVASCLLQFIEERVKKNIKEFVFYSDNCWSQNKNTKVLSMMNLASVKFDVKITHRFLEKGHTHMEVDNVHACIENRSKTVDIFTPGQWYAIIKIAKINDPKYKVIEMEQKNFFEFKDVAVHHKWNLGITKLREIVITGNLASFKHNYDDEARSITPLPTRAGRPVNLSTFKLKQVYTNKFAIPDNVLEDLKWYCKEGHIPSASQPYFNALFHPAEVMEAIDSTTEDEWGDSDSEPESEHSEAEEEVEHPDEELDNQHDRD